MKDNGIGEIKFNKAEQMIIKAACECFDKSEFVDHDAAVIKLKAYSEMAIALGQTTAADVEKIKMIVKSHYKMIELLKK